MRVYVSVIRTAGSKWNYAKIDYPLRIRMSSIFPEHSSLIHPQQPLHSTPIEISDKHSVMVMCLNKYSGYIRI